jgi:hypothetical protein
MAHACNPSYSILEAEKEGIRVQGEVIETLFQKQAGCGGP